METDTGSKNKPHDAITSARLTGAATSTSPTSDYPVTVLQIVTSAVQCSVSDCASVCSLFTCVLGSDSLKACRNKLLIREQSGTLPLALKSQQTLRAPLPTKPTRHCSYVITRHSTEQGQAPPPHELNTQMHTHTLPLTSSANRRHLTAQSSL